MAQLPAGTRMRLLGDRVLQSTAWKEVAEELGWTDTLDAEYVALTQLHADALITFDRDLARSARSLVLWRQLRHFSDPDSTIRSC
jgi:predicted nucleic acid-binding protein